MNPSTRALTMVLALVLVMPAVASIRCGTDLIQEGDSVVLLLEACGEPYFGDRGLLLGFGTGEVTYNFGPTEFMVRVTVRDGEVQRIENLDDGFIETEDDLQKR